MQQRALVRRLHLVLLCGELLLLPQILAQIAERTLRIQLQPARTEQRANPLLYTLTQRFVRQHAVINALGLCKAQGVSLRRSQRQPAQLTLRCCVGSMSRSTANLLRQPAAVDSLALALHLLRRSAGLRRSRLRLQIREQLLHSVYIHALVVLRLLRPGKHQPLLCRRHRLRKKARILRVGLRRRRQNHISSRQLAALLIVINPVLILRLRKLAVTQAHNIYMVKAQAGDVDNRGNQHAVLPSMLEHDFRLQQRLLPQLAEILQSDFVMLTATTLVVTLQLLQQAHERIASAQAGSHSVQRQCALLARSAQPLLQLQCVQQSRQLLRIARQRRTLALRLLHVADELV